MAEEKEKTSRDVMVVKELPTQEIKAGLIEDKEYDFLTTEEALTELINNVRLIKKSVA